MFVGLGLPAVAAKQRRLVPVEGIEPPLLAEHDFELSYVCYKLLILLIFYRYRMCMCKEMCKF